MACGLALKRPHDYESYLSPPTDDCDAGPGDAKRARPSTVGSPLCPPFRPQLHTIAASLPQSNKSLNTTVGSPFAEASRRGQLSSAELHAYLRSEIRTLKRRRILGPSVPCGDESQSTSSGYRKPPKSPTSSGSDSDEGEQVSPPRSLHRTANEQSGPKNSIGHDDEDGPRRPSTPLSSSTAIPKKSDVATLEQIYDKPHFSLSQVRLICERLLREQETQLRYEYERVLQQRLDEQHEQYVQFTREQLATHNRALGTGASPSYLS